MSSLNPGLERQYKIPYQIVEQTDGDATNLHNVSPVEPGHNYHSTVNENDYHGFSQNSRHNSVVGTSGSDKRHTAVPSWSIGLMTPAVIIGFLFLATAVAVAHFLYCHYMDQRFVESTIPQNWNNALTVVFARAFSTALAASASAAFTQLLWWYLRRKALSLSNIDALFSINTSPLKLYDLNLLSTTPILWFFGLLIPLISIATIFPPGSLVVQQLPDTQRNIAEVPTLNLDYRGNQTKEAFFEHAVFAHDVEGQYQGPNVRYLSIGKRTLMENTFLPRSSPCGANCSYTVSFSGPGLKCADTPAPNVTWHRMKYFAEVRDFTSINISYRTRTGGGIEWNREPGQWPQGGLRNISCSTQDTKYSAAVSYKNSIQSVAMEVLEEKPITDWWTGWPLNAVLMTEPSKNGSIDVNRTQFSSIDQLYDFYHKVQIAAVRDMLWSQMEGWVDNFGDFQFYNTSKTIMQETPLAEYVYAPTSYQYYDIYFNLAPDIVERLMQNVTISMLNDAATATTAEVTTTVYKAAYVFKDKPRLIVAYAATLGVCLVFVLLGVFALCQNGTPAFSGGFLQILCTTTYSESIMNHLAKDASLQGTQNLPKGLADLKVRYGLVTDSGSAKKYAAFGTVEETEVLLKGSSAQNR